MADESTNYDSPSSGLTPQDGVPGNPPLSFTLSSSSGFAQWSDISSPFCALTLSSTTVKSAPCADATPASVDTKDEIEEGEIHELLPIAPDVNIVPQFQSHPGLLCLESLNTMALNESQVLFYFGILAVQEFLLPRFEFVNIGEGSTWGVTLTVTPEQAKVEVCREALDRLRSIYPGWIVPDEPSDLPPDSGWDWCELLQKYCLFNGLQIPKYIKHFHEGGYRHEVELDGVTYSGALKPYSEESESQKDTAFRALHATLVSTRDAFCHALGPLTLEKSYKELLRLVREAHPYREEQRKPDARVVTAKTFLEVRMPKLGRLEEHYVSPRGQWHADALFKSDPFLTRVGPIGEVSTENSTWREAQEMCAQRVSQYLIDMVKKDLLVEQAAAKVRFDREQWGTKAANRAMFKGYVDSMQID
ncbi:uncharacterized protein LDX57_008833 [Aspergillus melleus]|uniref:uncharacterized protein n=1 Tax=Aspergillus melleus TaxID=138277 RepID=UPI001E8DC102|nr:uncharacterized protein LDX57_008833 [Aspergillus melleus]KAH8431174.1 hypothetical protein LDX57_008833 [Aspergillus melleus]